MLLVLVAAFPAFVVLVDFQWELHAQREAQARTIAFQQVELINDSMVNLMEATREVMLTLNAFGSVQRSAPSCAASLDRVRASLPSYPLLAVARPDGSLVCSSMAAALPDTAMQALVMPFVSADYFTVGRYANPPGFARPILTVALPLQGESGAKIGFVVAGLDLDRLNALLSETPQRLGGTMIVRDRDGTVLARAPAAAGLVGQQSDGPDRAMMGRRVSGATVFQERGGRQRVLGYVPLSAAPEGLFVSAGFDVADLSLGADRVARRGYVLIALGIAFSFLLALLFGHRTLRAPASVLLLAAQRLGGGDLAARARMPWGSASEFTGLGRAFNEMAEMLQRQRSELQGLNDALEIRVAERTRALLESNNRLQVEIAERELSEANLRQAQKLQAVGQLAGGVAHDFNNLLTVILGSLELLRKRLPDIEPRLTRLLDNATDSVERGARLTTQLLAFSRKQPLLSVNLDVADAIRGMGDLLASTLGATVRLHIKVEDGLWPAMLDPNQFEAGILNLALNAKAAMPHGGRASLVASNVAISEAFASGDVPPGDYVRVTVSDTGIGMSAETMARAFEPFFTTKEPDKGSGLGLSQVHGMVRQSGGFVTLASRPGDGTTVTMMFPRSLVAPSSASRIDYDFTLPALPRDRVVLLVDDDTQVREVTAAMLAENGYTIVSAADGAAGLAMLEQEGHRVALVIADYAMPGMTGRELLETVRSRRPDVAVLLATGYADYPDLTSETLAIDQIVRKPFKGRELLARIHMVCERQARAEISSGRV